jgi:hypothetical protein
MLALPMGFFVVRDRGGRVYAHAARQEVVTREQWLMHDAALEDVYGLRRGSALCKAPHLRATEGGHVEGTTLSPSRP